MRAVAVVTVLLLGALLVSADISDGKDRLKHLRPPTGTFNKYEGRKAPPQVKKPVLSPEEGVFIPRVTAVNGTADGTEKWAYVDVRPGAHMFWWLYFSSHPAGYLNRPIIIWLQGGPGSSSTGFGNFELIGPLNTQQQPRNTTWVKTASVLFIDNPVGAGYSYCDTPACFTTDVDQIAVDLVTLWKAFLVEFPEFQTIPLYIFGESYGGKMGAVFAQYLYNEINNPVTPLASVLAGFAMGNSFVSPFDSTYTWAPWLYYASNLDEEGVEKVTRAADACKAAADAGDWVRSTQLWVATEIAVLEETNDIDFYYILRYSVNTGRNRMPGFKRATPWNKNPPRPLAISEDAYRINLEPFAEDELYVLMNGEIRQKLGIIPDTVTWDGQSDEVWNNQRGDFMKDVIGVVANMTEYTNVQAIVYQGQLDLICDTRGALDWVNKMQWSGLTNYYSSPKVPLTDPWSLQTDTFVKVYNNFKFYWNLRAGHMVPRDDGNGAFRMVERILSNADTYP